jgi:hypothetical protein
MRRNVAARSSRDVEPDKQLPRYGLRKRTAQSDGKNLEDVSKHQTLAKRTRPTTTLTRARLSSSRNSVKKQAKSRSGQGWTKKNQDKFWFAEAILKESVTQYFIEYKPVYEGAQREISWQPKHYANAALVADWEERKRASGHENDNAELDNDSDLTSGDNGTSQRCGSVEYDDHLQNSGTDLRSLNQYVPESGSLEQQSVDLVNEKTSDGLEEPLGDTPPKTESTIAPGISKIPTPDRSVPVAIMYDNHMHKGHHDSSPVEPYSSRGASAPSHLKSSANPPAVMEDDHGCDEGQPRDDTATEVATSRSQAKSPKIASSTGNHLEMSASAQRSRIDNGEISMYAPVADGTKEFGSSLFEAATAFTPQNRNDHMSVRSPYNLQIKDSRRAKGLGQVPDGHVKIMHSQGRPFPRPGTSISTILSPEPCTPFENHKDDGSTTSAGKDNGQVSSRILAEVQVSDKKDPGVADAPPGKLASAREQLRSLLRGPGRRRYRDSGSL